MSKRIPLNLGEYALVDDEDYEMLSQYQWTVLAIRDKRYARRTTRNRCGQHSRYMHRIIMGAGPGQFVDHINDNGLDNRRANLRICTNQQNLQAQRPRRLVRGRPVTSLYKGVHWSKAMGKWKAGIKAEGKYICLGYFTSEHEAARAYNAAALEHFGEFARPNAIREAARARGLWPENGEEFEG